MNNYTPENPDFIDDPNDVMPDNIKELADAVVGHRISSAEKGSVEVNGYEQYGFVITLDDGTKVLMQDTEDCCAYTELEEWLLHIDRVENIITGVGTTDGYTKWHVYADFGDVLDLTVGWSGSSGYYGYGFWIAVVPVE